MDNNLSNISSGDAVLYAAIMAFLIGKDMNANELNIVGNFFQAIGQNLEVMSAISGGGTNNSGTNTSINDKINSNSSSS